MSLSLSEYLTEQFYAWEQRGRGWLLFEQPVHLEPKFIPFFGHYPPELSEQSDDGRRARFFPQLQEFLGLTSKPERDSYKVLGYLNNLYPVEPFVFSNGEPVGELQINFSKDTKIPFDRIEQLLLMLSTSSSIVSFEIIGTARHIQVQVATAQSDLPMLSSLITSYAPGVAVNQTSGNLESAFIPGQYIYITDLGLCEEFMRPLRVWTKFDPDPLIGCFAALEAIREGEMGMVQILFQGAVNSWAESILRSVSDKKGGGFFVNAPEMLPLAKEKVSSPLFGAAIRTVGQAGSGEKSYDISMRIAQSLISFQRLGSNTLIPLSNEEYNIDNHVEDVIHRRSRRLGMLLNTEELASLVHIPSASVVSPKLRLNKAKTKAPPAEVLHQPFELGINAHLGIEKTVTLSQNHRLRHMHLIGATGTGKSSLLLKLITQDIAQGNGIAVLDPHGDLIESILRHVPDNRINDVVFVDPSDVEFPIGLNLLSARSEAEKIILASDLVALFRRFATSWGDQMTSVLANAINAILESSQGGTLIDLRRFLVEASFRNQFLKTVNDPNNVYYWNNENKVLHRNAIGSILTRLDTFLRPRLIRNMMAQKEGIDFSDVINSGKILLVKLSQGLIGEENSYLLGTLFVTKLHQAAQARQNIPKEKRTPFYFYIDEFQNFITPSMEAILSGSRKYGLGLVLAHQDLEQLLRKDSELANSVMSNPAVRVCFRCGDKDAAKLSEGFSYFDASDLQNLGIGEAIVRVGQKDHDFNLTFDLVTEVAEDIATNRRQAITEHSRKTYGKAREAVEQLLKESLPAQEKMKVSEEPVPEVKEPIRQPEPEKSFAGKTAQQPPKDTGEEAKDFLNREARSQANREHRFIQEYIRRVAQQFGFKAVIEEAAGDGSVDVGLTRDNIRIACEISVTNTAQYEVHNIGKCFQAGYAAVFVISNDDKHLSAIRQKSSTEIPEQLHKRLFFISQKEFSKHLSALLPTEPEPTEERINGYRVKVAYDADENTQYKEAQLKNVVLGALRRGKGG